MPRFLQAVALYALCANVVAAPIVGSGVDKTESRAVSDFHALALGIPASVTIRQGASEGLTITGDDNILPLLETRVTKGVLDIQWADRRADVRIRKLDIVVDAKAIDALTVGGTGSIRAAALTTRALTATVGGSGSLAVDKLDTDALKTTVAGSGEIRTAGRADKLEATLAGSGRLGAASLQTRDAHLTLQGSPDATVRVRDALTVTVAGSGSVTYYGKPRVTQTVMGSGTVRNAAD